MFTDLSQRKMQEFEKLRKSNYETYSPQELREMVTPEVA